MFCYLPVFLGLMAMIAPVQGQQQQHPCRIFIDKRSSLPTAAERRPIWWRQYKQLWGNKLKNCKRIRSLKLSNLPKQFQTCAREKVCLVGNQYCAIDGKQHPIMKFECDGRMWKVDAAKPDCHCPKEEPLTLSPCNLENLQCQYGSTICSGVEFPDYKVCSNGSWKSVRVACQQETSCPVNEPPTGSFCNVEGLQCSFGSVTECNGEIFPDYKTCSEGVWKNIRISCEATPKMATADDCPPLEPNALSPCNVEYLHCSYGSSTECNGESFPDYKVCINGSWKVSQTTCQVFSP